MVCSDCSDGFAGLKSDVEFLVHQFVRFMSTVGTNRCECPPCVDKIVKLVENVNGCRQRPTTNVLTSNCSAPEVIPTAVIHHYNVPLVQQPESEEPKIVNSGLSRAQKRKARRYPMAKQLKPTANHLNSTINTTSDILASECVPVKEAEVCNNLESNVASTFEDSNSVIVAMQLDANYSDIRPESVEVDENVYRRTDHNYSQGNQEGKPPGGPTVLLRHLLSSLPPSPNSPVPPVGRCLSSNRSSNTASPVQPFAGETFGAKSDGSESEALRNTSSLANLTRIFCSNRRPPIKATVCPLCDERINSNNKARHILNSHTDLRPYACEDCGKTFKVRKTESHAIYKLGYLNIIKLLSGSVRLPQTRPEKTPSLPDEKAAAN